MRIEEIGGIPDRKAQRNTVYRSFSIAKFELLDQTYLQHGSQIFSQ